METFYLILIGLLAVGVLLLLLWLKPDLAKKYWAYIAAGVVAVGGLVFALTQRKRPAPTPDPEMAEKEDQLRADLAKVHEEAEQQITQARQEESEVQAEVTEIQGISDEQERLKRLADLFNKTRRRR